MARLDGATADSRKGRQETDDSESRSTTRLPQKGRIPLSEMLPSRRVADPLDQFFGYHTLFDASSQITLI